MAGYPKKEVTMRRLWNTTYRRIGRGLVVVLLTLFGLAAAGAASDQVPWSASGTGGITSVTRLTGGLTRYDISCLSTATYLGEHTVEATRIQDNQGNFTGMECRVAANGTNSVCAAYSGHLERTQGSCVGTFMAPYTVTSGTGMFANATGGGTITVQIDFCAGTSSATQTGTISRPHSE